MRLGGEVDDRVDTSGDLPDQLAVLDAADHELDGVRHVLAPPRVGELVEHDDLVVGLEEAHVRGADEPGAAGHEQLHARTPR
jgi:hypothetical protein